MIFEDRGLISNIWGRLEHAGKQRVNDSRWEPELEDACWRAVSDRVSIFDLVVGDSNNDGKVDLAYTASEGLLTVRYQNDDGMWSDVQELRV